ncbi:MAG: hypothetical protein ABI760_12620 [Ferruginibacter sp.]
MKYTTSILIAVIVLSFESCKKQPEHLNENYIPVNKCQSFEVDGKILVCCLDSVIQDSRCPVNAICIWQGIAVARFSLNSENKNHIITLATTNFPPYNKEAIVSGFKIEFKNLLPQREMGKPFNYHDYVAELRITRP